MSGVMASRWGSSLGRQHGSNSAFARGLGTQSIAESRPHGKGEVIRTRRDELIRASFSPRNEAVGAAGPSAVGDALGGGIAHAGGSAAITASAISGNLAQGGVGGNGEGGGIANLLSAHTTVTGGTINLNAADGGAGGAGLGGGVFNDATSTLVLDDALVILNQAIGAPGIGGGVYTVGTFSDNASTVIKLNHASTSGNDIGP